MLREKFSYFVIKIHIGLKVSVSANIIFIFYSFTWPILKPNSIVQVVSP